MKGEIKKRRVDGSIIAKQALLQVCVNLPWLSGLAHFVRLQPTRRTSTAGIFESGRLVYNPDFLVGLTLEECTFVMAHELMHLALRTHARGHGGRRLLVNIAHDYVINDLLREELGSNPPDGCLVLDGARHRSLEELVSWLERERKPQRQKWPMRSKGVTGSAVRDALERAGMVEPDPFDLDDDFDDVLDESIERKWFPATSTGEQASRAETGRQHAAEATARHRAWSAVTNPGGEAGNDQMEVEMLQGVYRTPWQQALQRWIEFHAPGNRSFSRPSRRSGSRTDVVLPGRIRESWTIHMVLDTSGSMIETFPRVLGALAAFAASAGVGLVHVLQCDAAVTRDEWIEVENLDRVTIAGLGGSNLSPAMDELSLDPTVEAVLVLTDGCILYPEAAPSYDVIWVLTEPNDSFQPAYGQCIVFESPEHPSAGG
jgi:predicted metal-dependent peptidase